ncbi:hypothetical protein BH10PSE7_BH10PSE7_04700 [soil metagenome]
MKFHAFAAIAAVIVISASIPAGAAEVTKSQAPKTTAAAEPSQLPVDAKPAPVEMLPMGTPAERPMQSMTSGHSGCHHNAPEETVFLTN